MRKDYEVIEHTVIDTRETKIILTIVWLYDLCHYATILYERVSPFLLAHSPTLADREHGRNGGYRGFIACHRLYNRLQVGSQSVVLIKAILTEQIRAIVGGL